MSRTADQVFNESFLEVRAKLLEVAATLDRVDRVADGSQDTLEAETASQRSRIDDAIRICLSEGPDRTERLQRLFSRQYEPNWRNRMNV